MPTSKAKNLLYKFMLPLSAPAVPDEPVAAVQGRHLRNEKDLITIIRRCHITGGALLFCTGDKSAVILTKSYHTDKIPDTGTYFRVASITKMAAALVAVYLIDRGILDPDKPAADIIPDCGNIPELRHVTAGHLLSHTSGLIDPPDLENKLIHRVPLREAVSGCVNTSSDGAFRYSNLGYGILGCIFESLLNLSVEDIFQKYLFDPLGMEATLEGCSLIQENIMPVVRILPYHPEKSMTVTELGKKPLNGPDPLYHYGHTAGSMYVTLFSLSVLLRCIRDGGNPLLSGSYASYMKTEKAKYGKISPTLSYGSGLLLVRDARISNSMVIGHQGFAYGCVDGAFWEENTGNMMISLNGGCSERRIGRLGAVNFDLCRFAFRKELPSWKQ